MKNYVSSFDKKLEPTEYAELMFKNTNNDGILYIPGWYYLNEPRHILRCLIKWNKRDLEAVIIECNKLIDGINKIAETIKNAKDSSLNIKKIITDEYLNQLWNIYFTEFSYAKFDKNKIKEIAEKIETISTIKLLEHKMWARKSIESYERKLYEEYKNLTITKEEEDEYSAYCEAFYRDCKKRVGENIGAVDLILRVRRLCKVIEIDAPKDIVNSEACMLIATLIVHKFALSIEKINYLSEEEEEEYLDKLYRPKKKNNRKHNLNLFVYKILEKYSNKNKHMSQAQILEKLETDYELTIERKALSRAIHDIEDEHLGIFTNPKGGTWYDENGYEYE